ncbi:hypothetical protein A2U01_0079657, partial [Trifolium medium]|nr:hypothetical protein [Trifolium medium]
MVAISAHSSYSYCAVASHNKPYFSHNLRNSISISSSPFPFTRKISCRASPSLAAESPLT